MGRIFYRLIIWAAVFYVPSFVYGAGGVPGLIPFQGRLTDVVGNPVSTQVEVKFRLYPPPPAVPMAECYVYEETQQITPNSYGLFSTTLGSGASTGPSNTLVKVFSNDPGTPLSDSCSAQYTPVAHDYRRVEVVVNGVPMGDMQVIGSSAYAFNTETLQGLGADQFIQVSGAITQSNISKLVDGSDASSLHNHDSLYVGKDNFNNISSIGNITSSGNISSTGTLSSLGGISTSGSLTTDKWLGLGKYSDTDEASPSGVLYSALGAAGASAVGRMWVNTTTNELKYWDGTSVQTVSSAAASKALATSQIFTGSGDLQLTAAISDTSTSLTLNNTLGFPKSGYLWLPNEVLSYSSISGNTLNGLSRGLFGTPKKNFSAGTTAYGFRIFSPAGDSTQLGGFFVLNQNHVLIGTGEASGPFGGRSLTIGHNSRATGWNSLAVGGGARAVGGQSLAAGDGAWANGSTSFAAGRVVTSDSFAQATFGRMNQPIGGENKNSWIATDPLFVLGNGDDTVPSASNALIIFKNGNSLFNGGQTVSLPASNVSMTVMGKTTDSSAAAFNVTANDGTSRFLVRNDGKVVIGSPTSMLEVKGDITANSAGNSIAVGHTSTAIGYSAVALGDSAHTSNSGAVAIGFAASATGSRSIALGPQSSAAGGYSAAFGYGAGVNAEEGVAIGRNVRVGNAVGDGTGTYSIGLSAGKASGSSPIVTGINSVGVFLGDQSGVNVSASQVMAIMGGNVGIGNNNPQNALDVTGNIAASGCLKSSAGVASGLCASDQRLKKDIAPFDTGLDALMGITPHYFKYNGLGNYPQSERLELGVIAQEVERTAPELIVEKKVLLRADDKEQTEIKQVNYTALTYVLINAVKDLYHRWSNDRSEVHQELASLREENRELRDYICQKDSSAPFCDKK